jgi:prepilin-type N-terminal cleavage/methylation domain-containing protein
MRFGLNNLRLGLRFSCHTGASARRCRAFTLIEMLVVLIIIAILAALVLPHIRGNLESQSIDAACRQLLDDLSFARQKAISQRTTVAVLFVPPSIQGQTLIPSVLTDPVNGYTTNEIQTHKRLQGGVYTHYALYAFRRVGEQPGIHSTRYITEWKSLPEKTFIDPAMFPGGFYAPYQKFAFPFTRAQTQGSTLLPYIAFDSQGRCVRLLDSLRGTGIVGTNLDVRIARGSILFTRETDEGVLQANYDVQQIPPGNASLNTIHIDALTGRAEWIKAELQ